MPIYNKNTVSNNFLLFDDSPNCLLVYFKELEKPLHQHISLDVITELSKSDIAKYYLDEQTIFFDDDDVYKNYIAIVQDIYKNLGLVF